MEEKSIASERLFELEQFCLGPAGRAAARADLTRYGLPADADHVDDICQQVLVGIWARLSTARDDEPSEDHLTNVAAYARRSIRNAVVDLLRGRSGRERLALGNRAGGAEADYPTEDGGSGLPDDRDPEAWTDATSDRRVADELRWAIQSASTCMPDRDGWLVSATLALTHLADHPDLEPPDGAPLPDPRSPAAGHASRWVALFYAGRLDCFDRPETGAVRERRSRALKRVERMFLDGLSRSGEGGVR